MENFEGTLIHSPHRISSVVVMLIHELNLPIKIVALDSLEKTRTESHLKLNANGRVPVYFEGAQESPSFVLVESSAIVMYLLEKYDKNHVLFPKIDETHKRAKMWQFFSFASSELYPFIAKSWDIMYKPGQTPEQMQKELAQLGEKWKNEYSVFLERELGAKPYLLGDHFSAADLIVSYEMGMLAFGILNDKYPVLKAFQERLAQRESYKAIFADMGPKK